MIALIDITGQRFNRWTVVARVSNRGPHARFRCVCDCGNEKDVVGYSLRRGESQSCGCLGVENCQRLFTTHGHTKNLKADGASPTYISWYSMIERCKNPERKHHHGRGVVVCERWLVFENFLADMGERPPGRTIDRYPDNAGNYEPGNCRWATSKEQAANRRARSAPSR